MDSNTRLYIVLHTHRHGIDTWPIFSIEQPSSGDIIEKIKAEDEWDDEDDVEVRGPFPVGP